MVREREGEGGEGGEGEGRGGGGGRGRGRGGEGGGWGLVFGGEGGGTHEVGLEEEEGEVRRVPKKTRKNLEIRGCLRGTGTKPSLIPSSHVLLLARGAPSGRVEERKDLRQSTQLAGFLPGVNTRTSCPRRCKQMQER